MAPWRKTEELQAVFARHSFTASLPTLEAVTRAEGWGYTCASLCFSGREGKRMLICSWPKLKGLTFLCRNDRLGYREST